MTHLLYDIAIRLAALFFIPWHLVRSIRRNRPAAFSERFGKISPAELERLKGERPIWVHAVSVGETIAVKPLLRALKERFPERKIVVSNVTETGRSVALSLAEADLCIYFPFDFGFAVSRVLESIQPALVLIVETEIWPNFLRTARRRGIPTVMVNGRISDRSFGRYLRLSWFFRPVLADLARFCMQTEEDARRIIAIGAPADRVEVTRNLKYDLPVTRVDAAAQEEIRHRFALPTGVPVFTAGSTHQGEEEAVIAAYRRLVAGGQKLVMVLVPRHPERAPLVAELLKQGKLAFTLRSAIDGDSPLLAPGEVLLVDTVGELMRLYAVSDVVFVGGSLVPTGGHNILEPASLRVPVLFGPHMSNFRESAELIRACGGGIRIEDERGLADELAGLLSDPDRRHAMGEKGAGLLEMNSGSTGLHVTVAERFLKGS